MKCRSGKPVTGLQHCVSAAVWALRSESKDCDVDFTAWNSCLCQGKLDIGGMGERLKPAVLKTAVRGTVPGVRIPLPPLNPLSLRSASCPRLSSEFPWV